jgi:hypothetical protein
VSAGYQESESSSITIPYKSTTNYTNTNYMTKFEYQFYVAPCVEFVMQPAGFVGGNAQPTITPPVAEDGDWCQWYEPNKTQAYTFTSSTAVTFNAGVNIATWLGINLSSQTGYDSNASASYLLPKGGYLCGSTHWAGSNDEGLVFAGKFQIGHHRLGKK